MTMNNYSKKIYRDLFIIAILTIIVSVSTIAFDCCEEKIIHMNLYGNYELTNLLITSLFLVASLSVFSHKLYSEIKSESANLEEANTKFQEIFDNSNDSILVLRNDGSILDANLTAINQMGYSKDELLKMSITDLYDHEAFDSLKDKPASIFETQGSRKDGSIIPVEISKRSFAFEGKPRTISIVRDITERKEAQRAISAKAEAEELNRIKSNFLANMSHELRTPLNSIIGFSQILTDGKFGELNEKQGKYTANILRSGEHLLELINDILDLSKVEAGKMPFTPETVSVKSTIAGSKMFVQPLADQKSIKVTDTIDSDTDEIFADSTKLKQILYNLLSNAIKFTPENGDVAIVVRKEGDKMLFSVSDSGIGISKNDQKTIFDPFKQVKSFKNRDAGGTGLGLSLVKEYVEMHGGTIEVDSKVDAGSTFSFSIPVNSRKE